MNSFSKIKKKPNVDQDVVSNDIFSTPAFGAARDSNLLMEKFMFSLNKPNQNALKDLSKPHMIPELEERPEPNKNVTPDYRKNKIKIRNADGSRINNEQKTSLSQHSMRKKKNTIEDDSDDVEIEPVHAHQTDLSTPQKQYVQQSRNEPFKETKKNVVNEHQKQAKGSEKNIANRYKA